MDPVFATLRAASGLRRPNRGYSETETGSDLALEFGPDEFGPGDNSASFNMSPPVYSSRDFPRWIVERNGLKRMYEGDKVEIIGSVCQEQSFVTCCFMNTLKFSFASPYIHVWYNTRYTGVCIDTLFLLTGTGKGPGNMPTHPQIAYFTDIWSNPQTMW